MVQLYSDQDFVMVSFPVDELLYLHGIILLNVVCGEEQYHTYIFHHLDSVTEEEIDMFLPVFLFTKFYNFLLLLHSMQPQISMHPPLIFF